MIIQGTPIDHEVLKIKKSISENLRNKNIFNSVNEDTTENTIRLIPPVSMHNCYYIFRESSDVRKCSRILADDIIYNTITLTPAIDDPDNHLITQVRIINKFLDKNIEELHNLLIDYYYAGWGAVEYVWNNTSFKLKQIPIHTCSIIQISINNQQYYLLEQQVNSTFEYFRIMGEDYPNDFNTYNNQPLSDAALLGGDNIYQFFTLPVWVQHYEDILTEISIRKMDYNTISKGNINNGILNIHLEPLRGQPKQYDPKTGEEVQVKSRQEVIGEELKSANGGTAVFFTEGQQPASMNYVSLSKNNNDYLTTLKKDCQQSVLNDYGIPIERLMENTGKESMNSDKTQRIWQIYTLDLHNKQKIPKQFIIELIYELYNIFVDVEITTPIFTDMRETEIKLHSQAWNDGALNLEQYVTALSEFLPVIDLNDYDFNKNPEIWEYRKIPELNTGLSPEDMALLDEIEAQYNETHTST